MEEEKEGDDDANQKYDDAAVDDGYNHYVNTDDAIYYNYAAHDNGFYCIDDDIRRGLRKLKERRVAWTPAIP